MNVERLVRQRNELYSHLAAWELFSHFCSPCSCSIPTVQNTPRPRYRWEYEPAVKDSTQDVVEDIESIDFVLLEVRKLFQPGIMCC